MGKEIGFISIPSIIAVNDGIYNMVSKNEYDDIVKIKEKMDKMYINFDNKTISDYKKYLIYHERLNEQLLKTVISSYNVNYFDENMKPYFSDINCQHYVYHTLIKGDIEKFSRHEEIGKCINEKFVTGERNLVRNHLINKVICQKKQFFIDIILFGKSILPDNSFNHLIQNLLTSEELDNDKWGHSLNFRLSFKFDSDEDEYKVSLISLTKTFQ